MIKESPMVTIGMNYVVLSGKEEVFERAFKQVLEALQQSAGHSQSLLYRDVSAPNSYLILSEWNDTSAFDDFVRSEAFARVTTWGKENILASRPKHTIYHQ